MKFLFYSVALNFLVLTVSTNYSVPIENGQLSNDFRPRTAAKVYNPCGTACPLTCANLEPRVCILVCKADWFCPEGYYENSVGQCVVRDDCDIVKPTPDPDPVPLPEPFPTYSGSRPWPRPRPIPRPLPRPLPRPFSRPFPISFPRPIVQNLTEVSNDFVQYPDLSGFQTFEPIEPPKFNLYPSLPKPSFQISPVKYNATAIANGAPSQPSAVVRTTGSNAPYISRPAISRVAPLIDLDPTVLRPALRVSREQLSEDDKQ